MACSSRVVGELRERVRVVGDRFFRPACCRQQFAAIAIRDRQPGIELQRAIEIVRGPQPNRPVERG